MGVFFLSVHLSTYIGFKVTYITIFWCCYSLFSRKSLCTCTMVWQISTKITEDTWSREAKPNFWVKLIQKQQEVIIKVKFPKFVSNWCIFLWCPMSWIMMSSKLSIILWTELSNRRHRSVYVCGGKKALLAK